MSTFLKLLSESNKDRALLDACTNVRRGQTDDRVFAISPESFAMVPGKPFAYWVTDAVRSLFTKFPALGEFATVTSGTGTLDDFRFLRCWWEVPASDKWYPFAKGGAYSPIYYDQHLVVNWANDGAEMKEWIVYRYGGGHWARNIRSTEHYFRPGLTWPRRTNGLSFRVMSAGCIFADKGPAAFVENNDANELLALACILNSSVFCLLVSVQLARVELAQSFEVGLIQQTPVPPLDSQSRDHLASLARKFWSVKRKLDSTVETSHAFLLPATLASQFNNFDCSALSTQLSTIHAELNDTIFDLYGLARSDATFCSATSILNKLPESSEDEDDDQSEAPEMAPLDALLSWAVGVAFGRFEARLVTENQSPKAEPSPFDRLPAKSPGMVPDGVLPLYSHTGILVNDEGHPSDLPRRIQEVLESLNVSCSNDIRRWLERDFFAFHLQRYSKSRRKAPIYWPLATASGKYTLWLYYPDLSSQTLYTAVNDFVDPKLKRVSIDAALLSNQTTERSRDDEKRLEELQASELELTELRDALLKLAPNYKPNLDDGVQITAAPLWSLFRYKPWQKVLKDTWQKMEKGDYEWAHLSINYWPSRVREKCKRDKSLAIAHGLESLYVERGLKTKATRGGGRS